jgi:hypothetical protein
MEGAASFARRSLHALCSFSLAHHNKTHKIAFPCSDAPSSVEPPHAPRGHGAGRFSAELLPQPSSRKLGRGLGVNLG